MGANGERSVSGGASYGSGKTKRRLGTACLPHKCALTKVWAAGRQRQWRSTPAVGIWRRRRQRSVGEEEDPAKQIEARLSIVREEGTR
jgi:hypothetical protein